MPDDLKNHLAKEAKINGRSLNSEIVTRLQLSLEKQAYKSHRIAEPGAVYQAQALTDAERQLLSIFKKMPPEKQLALISLFK